MFIGSRQARRILVGRQRQASAVELGGREQQLDLAAVPQTCGDRVQDLLVGVEERAQERAPGQGYGDKVGVAGEGAG